MLLPSSWDDTPVVPINPRLLLELMVRIEAQGGDADGAGSLERAHIRHRVEAEIDRHLCHLAELGLITARAVPGRRRRVCALSESGRGWCREHFDIILRDEG